MLLSILIHNTLATNFFGGIPLFKVLHYTDRMHGGPCDSTFKREEITQTACTEAHVIAPLREKRESHQYCPCQSTHSSGSNAAVTGPAAPVRPESQFFQFCGGRRNNYYIQVSFRGGHLPPLESYVPPLEFAFHTPTLHGVPAPPLKF